MAQNRFLRIVAFVLLVAVSASLAGCGRRGRVSSQSAPAATTPYRLDTGSWGLPLYCPKYVTHDQQGNLYVADSDTGYKGNHRDRVVKLSPTGQRLGEWHVFNTMQSLPTLSGTTISGPFGLTVDAQGIIDRSGAGSLG